MADREERLEEGTPPQRPAPAPAPAPPPVAVYSRRARIRRTLSSRPQLRDMVIVQELLLPPLGVRDREGL